MRGVFTSRPESNHFNYYNSKESLRLKKIYYYNKMIFANTWKEEAGKYGITANNNKLIMTVLKEYTNDSKILTTADKIKLRGNDNPNKRYQLALRQLKSRVVYKQFHNTMMKVSEKIKRDAARKKAENRIRAQLIKKLNDPALINAVMTHLRGNLGTKISK